jgi:membrane dipeptidase
MSIFISDSHNDFLTSIKNKEDREKYISECRDMGLKLLSCAVFTTEQNLSINDIKNFDAEIKSLSSKHNIKLLLSIEDLGVIKNKNELLELIELKPFSITLTWNYANQFAGGSETNLGLTTLGKYVIKLLEENNILIDTAHLSKKAFWEFAKVTTKPIFNSHSNIYSLFNHHRNLTDDQIQTIVDTNGYMGLTIYEKFISSSSINSEDIAKQFEYLINKFGYNNFGLGTDFYGTPMKYTPEDIKSYSNFINLYKHLKQSGVNKRAPHKLLLNNFLNFLNQNI